MQRQTLVKLQLGDIHVDGLSPHLDQGVERVRVGRGVRVLGKLWEQCGHHGVDVDRIPCPVGLSGTSRLHRGVDLSHHQLRVLLRHELIPQHGTSLSNQRLDVLTLDEEPTAHLLHLCHLGLPLLHLGGHMVWPDVHLLPLCRNVLSTTGLRCRNP